MKTSLNQLLVKIALFFMVLISINTYAVDQVVRANNKDSLFVFLFENYNFFRNAEYFNPILDGYSDLGFYGAAKLEYRINNSLVLTGGIHFMKFSGESSFSEIQPLYTLTYRPNKRLLINMGTLNKPKVVDIPDQIYFDDLFWKDNVENGFQIEYRGSKFKSDLWIDWENHITSYSHDQEKFLFGFSGNYSILSDKHNMSIDIPVTFVATHSGGQINDSDDDLISIANSSTGLNMSYKFQAKSQSKLMLKYKYLTYLDLSQSKNQFFSKGFGHNTEIEYSFNKFKIFSGYWYGYHYVSSKGNPIFMSISQRNDWYTRPIRKLLVQGVKYSHHINSYSFINIDLTAYSDTEKHDLDYSFLVSIKVNLSKILK